MNKKKILLVIVVVGVIAIGALGAAAFSYKSDNSYLIRECPDQWIENRMPPVESDASERQYFIFKSERKEIKQYDIDWIKNNCSVQVEYVY